jgi:hypothetical protein
LPEGVDAPAHYVVFTQKEEPLQLRLQELRVEDLEVSGMNVHMIDSHKDLGGLLGQLEVRCRPARLFISGSFELDGDSAEAQRATAVARAIGTTLASSASFGGLSLATFGGPAGQVLCKQYRDALAAGSYDPNAIQFYYRKAADSDESVPIAHRVGVSIFTELPLDEMRKSVFEQIRAMVVIAGSRRTKDEASVAQGYGAKVVPVAMTGGAAKELWEETSPADLGLDRADEIKWWFDLADHQPELAANAAAMLIKRLMFE